MLAEYCSYALNAAKYLTRNVFQNLENVASVTLQTCVAI